jgi:hypothetical protein
MKWFLIRHGGTAKEETFSFLENPKTAPSSTNRSIWRHPRSVLICADLWDKGPCLFVIHDPFLTASLGDLPNLAVNPSSKRRRCGPHRPTGVQEVSRKMRDTAGGTPALPFNMRLIIRADLWGMHLPHLRQYFKVAKRTWHGRSEAKAQRSLPICHPQSLHIRVDSHSFAVQHLSSKRRRGGGMLSGVRCKNFSFLTFA